MPVEITIDQTQLDAAMRRLEKVPYAVQRAVLPAVSEMLRDTVAVLYRGLGQVPLPHGRIRSAVRVTGVRMEGNVAVGRVMVRSPRGIPLIEYDVDPAEITARPGMVSHNWPGFTYSLRAGQRRRSADYPHGEGLPFIARMPGGHLGVYYRTDWSAWMKNEAGYGGRKSGLWGKGKRGVKEHAAIRQAYAPSVQYHAADPEIEETIVGAASAKFPDILSRYVDRAIAAHGGGKA